MIDAWKLPIFERHLSSAGYTYDYSQPGKKILTISIAGIANLKTLAAIIKAANTEAARTGAPKK